MTGESTSQVLYLLGDVLREADLATGGVNVVPVVVDNFAYVLSLVREVSRFGGLPFAEADEAVAGVRLRLPDSHPDPRLVDLVQRVAVDPSGSGTPVNLVVTDAGSTLTVRVGTDPEPTNPGDRNRLGVYSALLDPYLTGHRLAVLAYDETYMAADAREAVWQFVLDELPASGATLPNTLLVVVGATQIDYRRHCRPGPGARWALMGGSVLWRRRSQSDETEIAKIADSKKPATVLILGAGASLSSKLVSGDELRNVALRRQVLDVAERGEPVEAQAREFFRHLASIGRLMPFETDGVGAEERFVRTLTLERVLREEVFQLPRDEVPPTLQHFADLQADKLDHPGAAMRGLRRLLALRRRLVLLTVNFDQLIEHDAVVLRPGDPDPYDTSTPTRHDPPAVRLFVTEADFAAFPAYYEDYRRSGGAVPLVKLHGTIDRPETVRANVDDTLPGLGDDAAALLRSLVPPVGESVDWTYVGCSMRDPDIAQVTGTKMFAERTYERWVAPMVDPHVSEYVERVRRPAWLGAGLPNDMRERVITQSADLFVSRLVEHLLRP